MGKHFHSETESLGVVDDSGARYGATIATYRCACGKYMAIVQRANEYGRYPSFVGSTDKQVIQKAIGYLRGKVD